MNGSSLDCSVMLGMISAAQAQFGFGMFDANWDGYLGRNEYSRGMFDVYDSNNDLLLDSNEFGLFGSDLGLL